MLSVLEGKEEEESRKEINSLVRATCEILSKALKDKVMSVGVVILQMRRKVFLLALIPGCKGREREGLVYTHCCACIRITENLGNRKFVSILICKLTTVNFQVAYFA